MSRLDRSALITNALAILVLLFAFIIEESEPFAISMFLGVLGLMLSSAAIVRNTSERPPETTRHPDIPVNELDAAAVLDLDARLEALEAAQQDAVDAARWRALVESGQIAAPAAPSGVHAPAGDSRQRTVA